MMLTPPTRALIQRANDLRAAYVDICDELQRKTTVDAAWYRRQAVAARANVDWFDARTEALEAIARDVGAGLQ